jgi:hypothetical protein
MKQPLKIMELVSKLAILETLREMDSFQTQKVLDFVRSISPPASSKTKSSPDYSRFKEQALREIQLALKK